jgi:thiamine-phosphate pyrophosphorylase
MKLILISNPTDLNEEVETIHSLFEKGLECFHLRKPEKTKKEFEDYLRKVNPKFYNRIVIHSNYHLLSKYNLKGMHIPEALIKEDKIKDLQKAVKTRGLSVSASVHSIDTIKQCKSYDYIFLSPVFDSISKKGYSSNIDLNTFMQKKEASTFPTKVIGLGGVSKENITLLSDVGFDGAALLGSIWLKEKKEERVKEFVNINSVIVQLTDK